MRLPECENHIFNVWSVCVSMCVCVCVSVISITRNQIKAATSNLVFTFVSHTDATFYKDSAKTLRTGTHKRILIYYGL